jgi:zinc and cadmium transporter
MSAPFPAAIVSSILVSLLGLIGVITLFLDPPRLQRITYLLISLAVGALIGDAVLHLLPEIFRKDGTRGSYWILAGLFVSFFLEKFLRWKQDHGIIPHGQEGHVHVHAIKPVGRIILIADGLHNFIDGLLIGASYLASIPIGIATTFAVIFHELPHELGDFGVLVDSGWKPGRALLFNFLSACVAIFGVLAAFVFQSFVQDFTTIGLSITAGSFLYIAGSNLIPELQKESAPSKSFLQIITILAGIGFMALLLRAE